jgi:hypothetical protein
MLLCYNLRPFYNPLLLSLDISYINLNEKEQYSLSQKTNLNAFNISLNNCVNKTFLNYIIKKFKNLNSFLNK